MNRTDAEVLSKKLIQEQFFRKNCDVLRELTDRGQVWHRNESYDSEFDFILLSRYLNALNERIKRLVVGLRKATGVTE